MLAQKTLSCPGSVDSISSWLLELNLGLSPSILHPNRSLPLQIPGKSVIYMNPIWGSLRCGLAKTHRFVDGNKGTAFLALGLFLAVNGWRLETMQIDAIETMLSLAPGTPGESELANWVRN